jgi:hypothetical protein
MLQSDASLCKLHFRCAREIALGRIVPLGQCQVMSRNVNARGPITQVPLFNRVSASRSGMAKKYWESSETGAVTGQREERSVMSCLTSVAGAVKLKLYRVE